MKAGPVRIKGVQKDSIAEEAGIAAGDILLSVNGEKIKDVFDYRFLIAEEELLLEIGKADGEIWEIEVEKGEYEDLGIEFETSMMDEAKSCANQCVFCFIDQLPGGMRETLYFKDDDSRLSFLSGNYVTLTNMRDADMDRIIRYRMSPINVSVHTTRPELRVFMLKNRFAGNVLPRIKKLVDHGIVVNGQVVLCRGMNDGKELDTTIEELSALYPGLRSISVVPVGITRYRKNLCELKPYDREASLEVVRQVEAWQRKLLQRHQSRIVYLADEFYIMAGAELPGYEAYEDFPQVENGVGMLALLRQEFHEYWDQIQAAPPSFLSGLRARGKGGERSVSIATGASAFAYIKTMAEAVQEKIPHLKIRVYEIKNCFFGETVTVTGLLTGKDIMEQLEGKALGEELLISSGMLRAGEDVLLDDITLDMLEKKLKVRVTAVQNSGRDFIEKIIGGVDIA